MTTTTTPSITVTAGDLRPATTALAKVVKKNAALPVLQHLKVEPVGRKFIRLTGTDLDTFFTIDVPAKVPAKADPFLVPLVRLQEQIRGAKAKDPVALRQAKAPPLSEFPETPRFRASPIELEPRVMGSLQKAFACSSTDNTRRVLQGACLDPTGKNGHHIVATDGRHLFAADSIRLEGLKEPVILPALKLAFSDSVRYMRGAVLRISAPTGESGQRFFRLNGSHWSLTGRLIDGTFPNYRQVIPPDSEFKTRIVLPEAVLDPLAKAIRQLPGRTLQNRPIGLRIGADSLGILARQDEKSPYEELLVQLAGRKGPDATLFLNRDYLVKALAFGMTRIDIIDATSPVRCTGQNEFMIIMPVREMGKIEVEYSRPLNAVPSNNEGSNGHRPKPAAYPVPPAKRQPQQKGAPMPATNTNTTQDPIEAAAGQINDIKEALKTAVTGLNSLAATLKVTRQRQRQTEKQVRTVRSTLRSLQKVEL